MSAATASAIPTPAATGPWPDRVNILGVGVSAANMDLALAQFDAWIASRASQYVCVADVHSVMQGRWNDDVRAIHNRAGMVTADGMPLVWLCRRARGAYIGRVYGPDLLMAACAYGLERGWRHYFYGGAPGVAEQLVARLTERFPGLAVAGVDSPPFRPMTPEEEAQTAARINGAGADIVWVGLGAPKQERWMRDWRGRLSAPILVGVGAAFDFHAGSKPQAPAWAQRSGLEWAFRLASEPKRLWPRYRKVIPGFLYGLALQRLGLSRPVID